MGLTVLQLNIRHWINNQYIFRVELNKYNPDIILLNETSLDLNCKINLPGFNSICKSFGPNTGTAILVNNSLSFESIPLNDPFSLAVKLFTDIGPIIICTSYVPPRIKLLPFTTISKVLNLHLPVLIMSDFNAHHPSLFGSTTNLQGRLLVNLLNSRNLIHLGPSFDTYRSGSRKGRPDIILTNQEFSLFHSMITPGNNVGSDHIPIIAKFQITPFVKVVHPKPNLNKLNISEYKNSLCHFTFPSLDGSHFSKINEQLNLINQQITIATHKNAPVNKVKVIQSYHPTPLIKRKLAQFQAMCLSKYRLGFPSTEQINIIKLELLNLIKDHHQNNWEFLVKTAYECYREPKKFWRKIRLYEGTSSNVPEYLTPPLDLIRSANLNILPNSKITDKSEQAEIMSKSWASVFVSNVGKEFKNPNTYKVQDWYKGNKHKLVTYDTIDFRRLPPYHPILRKISTEEIVETIKTFKDKSPGPSGITVTQLKYLPSNFNNAFSQIFNSILSTNHYPTLFGDCNMIFISKPNKDNRNPLNYRPICLLDLVGKVFEKIMANRIQYFLEYHNILNEKQFGFRSGRSPQQPIEIISAAVQDNQSRKMVTLVATRDVHKAFDTVWHKGLLYKFNQIPEVDFHLLSFLNSYIKTRKITPIFNGIPGSPITPKSGVPQGSCLGPILFTLFVNDLPDPHYYDSLIVQFADDVVHCVRAPSSKLKFKNAKRKLEKELSITKLWEDRWRIKTSVTKCNVAVIGGRTSSVQSVGGIKLGKNKLKLSNKTCILGYTLTARKHSTAQAVKASQRARLSLNKLFRFKSAPYKIKSHLYKAQVRSILEYPPSRLANSGVTSVEKLQRVQNKACRFITNTKLLDRVPSSSLHNKLKLDPLNIRLQKLSYKTLNKINKYFLSNNINDKINIRYKFSSFEITRDPHFQKSPTIAEKLNDSILSTLDHNPFIGLADDVEQHIAPIVPQYT